MPGMRIRTISCIAALSLSLGGPAAHADQNLADAAEQGDLATIERLVQNGTKVDSRLLDGTTALHWAVLRDQVDAARMLLDHGADPAAVNRNGMTPLYLAAQNGNAAMVALLLDAGASPNAVATTGESTLMTAARTGAPDVVELLISRGAQVDARDPHFQQ